MRKEGTCEELLCLAPKAPEWKIDWGRIGDSRMSPMIARMKETRQNPAWHGEGDGWTHTQMVCEALAADAGFQSLSRRLQEELFLAALLHDVGKIPTTRLEDGQWVSPGHTAVGARMAREFLWLEYGFCGKAEWQAFRETVCSLIRYHSVPPHILGQKHPERRLIQIASNGRLSADFSIKLLCLLVKADMQGRIFDDIEGSLETVELCEVQAEELDCLKEPFPFPTAASQYAYLEGRGILPGQEWYDDTWGEVVVMTGLPGTGKDTWIREHCSSLPMISLDELRRQMDVPPTAEQGPVVTAARQLAKAYLRDKIPFVWNATNLTPVIRGKLVKLFTDYHASVKMIYLETEWEEQLRRNRERSKAVPEQVIRRMLGYMTLPECFEAHRVEWHCV